MCGLQRLVITVSGCLDRYGSSKVSPDDSEGQEVYNKATVIKRGCLSFILEFGDKYQ